MRFAFLFAKFELDRTLVEVCQKEVPVFQILPDFTAFKTAINDCLEQTSTTHRTELKSLLSLRFQLFEKAQFSPV